MIDYSAHASLAFLSYKRPQMLHTALLSATQSPGFRHEIIVHDDGSSPQMQDEVFSDPSLRDLSAITMFSRTGHNEGVGRAINRCFSVATGHYLVKIDQDLVFQPNWLIRAIHVLEADPCVGMVGLFKYHHPPVSWREMQLSPGKYSGDRLTPEYHYVKDFVSSAFVITRDLYDVLGPLPEHSSAFAEDVEYKGRIQNEMHLKLALLDEDVCSNVGFGIGPSTVNETDGTVHKIKHGPCTRS